MWMRDGAGYFFGPIFIHPEETEHEPTKMFYKREVFLSNLEENCPMTCIIGILRVYNVLTEYEQFIFTKHLQFNV